MCVFFPLSMSSAAIVSSEQNPVIIIAVVAVAGTIILVFMVFGFIIGRRYALAGPIDSPLLWVCACQLHSVIHRPPHLQLPHTHTHNSIVLWHAVLIDYVASSSFAPSPYSHTDFCEIMAPLGGMCVWQTPSCLSSTLLPHFSHKFVFTCMIRKCIFTCIFIILHF